MDPDAHLTDEQKELLLSAEYYDRLNLATAYFPADGSTSFPLQQQVPNQSDDLLML